MSGLWNGEGLIPCFRAISCSHNACLLPFFTLYHYFMKWLPFFFLGSCIAFGEEIRGVVINVIDGDTIVVLEKTPEEKIVHKVRLEGIDAPERGQDGYDGAKHYLEKLIWGETVTVRYIGRDRYGRFGIGRCMGLLPWMRKWCGKDGPGVTSIQPAGNLPPMNRKPEPAKRVVVGTESDSALGMES